MHLVKQRRRSIQAACAAAVVLAHAAPAPAFAYRTLEDDPTLGANGPVVWDAPVVEVVLSEPPTGVVDVSRLEDAIRSACLTWSSVTGTSISLVYAGRASEPARPSDGVNTIELVTAGWESRGLPASVGGTTDLRLDRSEDGTVRILEADIYLDLTHNDWSFSGSGAVLDFAGILTHEQGHLLGLEHVCNTDAAPMCMGTAEETSIVMFPLPTGTSQRWLSDDDVSAIRYLYPAACNCPPDEMCELGRCVAECASPPCDGVCASDAQCTGGSCAIAGPAAGVCIAPAGYGAECVAGGDCASRLCLTTAANSFCTVPCFLDESCGAGMECLLVAGSRVCAPARHGGCAVGGPGKGSACWNWMVLAMLACSARSARRRVRR